MHNVLKYTLVFAAGAASAIGIYSIPEPARKNAGTASSEDEKPLYWVAPMDPDFRRDQPGKSPMGMDLVPVFATDNAPGVVEISPQVENSLGVRTTGVSRGTLSQTIRTVGYVQYDEDSLIHIHPRVEGWIEQLHVTAAGDPVEAGAALYDIYSPELVNAQEEFLSALSRGSDRLQQAAEDRLRALQLSDAFISSLRGDRKVLQTVTFTSPQNGVVDNLDIREGFFVGPETTLMSIGDLQEVWVEAQIFESQASLVRVGQTVLMRLDYLPGREWLGRVDYIYPSLDTDTRTLRVRLRFVNADRALRPNMYAQVEIQLDERAEHIVIPREALIRTGSQNRVVLALGNGRFKSIVVKTGRIFSSRVEILQGLSEGDEIVSSAQFLLDSESSKSSDFMRMDHPLESRADPRESADPMPMDHDHRSHAEPDKSLDSMPMDHNHGSHGESDKNINSMPMDHRGKSHHD
jgi:Cu(I)/Ag(I) efflux system membrane fusion protein